jgi:uncharacterized membrane protein HdeD (DUF308 family)
VTIRLWPLLAVRGLLASLFGVLALAWPGVTVYALVLLFGAYALVDGVGQLVAAARGRDDRRQRLAQMMGGVLGVGLGLLSLFWPGATAFALAILIGVWAITTGVAEIVAAVRLRRVIRGEVLLGLAGLASVIAGLLIVVRPDVAAVAIAQVIGVYALIYAALLIALALRVRRLEQERPLIAL